MGARTKARRRALELLYAADVRGMDLTDALAVEEERAAAQPERQSSWHYARAIAQGVIDRRLEIDELIETYAEGWTLSRMPAVDRAILRIGVWEIVYNPEVPAPVAIDEAIEAAKLLSTDDSPGFINGVLGTVAQVVPTATPDSPRPDAATANGDGSGTR